MSTELMQGTNGCQGGERESVILRGLNMHSYVLDWLVHKKLTLKEEMTGGLQTELTTNLRDKHRVPKTPLPK